MTTSVEDVRTPVGGDWGTLVVLVTELEDVLSGTEIVDVDISVARVTEGSTGERVTDGVLVGINAVLVLELKMAPEPGALLVLVLEITPGLLLGVTLLLPLGMTRVLALEISPVLVLGTALVLELEEPSVLGTALLLVLGTMLALGMEMATVLVLGIEGLDSERMDSEELDTRMLEPGKPRELGTTGPITERVETKRLGPRETATEELGPRELETEGINTIELEREVLTPPVLAGKVRLGEKPAQPSDLSEVGT